MNEKFVLEKTVLAKLAIRPLGPALSPLNTVLTEARRYSPPDHFKLEATRDEQLASRLIEKMKKPYRQPSPFASWMGQPFPHEYQEMVAADVERENG